MKLRAGTVPQFFKQLSDEIDFGHAPGTTYALLFE